VVERTGGRHPGFNPGPDNTKESCARNRMRGEQYLSALKEAAEATEIVAEDLGTVPPYVPESLLSIGLAGMRVPMWETEESGEFRAGTNYPYLTLATYATHDHDPIRVQWERARHEAQAGMGDPMGAAHFLQRLGRFADIPGFGHNTIPEYSDGVREKLLEALFATHSRYASVMITDLLGLEERFNVPGVLSDENWSYRLPFTMSQLREEPHWHQMGQVLRQLLENTQRATPSPAAMNA
ncbi:MAG: 4-alpha-glucanotransferase, partial [Verrucomicrobiota bacterium]